MASPWMVRRFDVASVDPEGAAARAGRRIRVEDRHFPMAVSRIDGCGGVELVRIRGHLGMHTDCARDQDRSTYYPWHEGMIWNLVLWSAGTPAALLRRGRGAVKMLPLEPGLALWLDITEVAHGVTSTPPGHPERHPEVVMIQVLGMPGFMRQEAVREAAVAVRGAMASPWGRILAP